MRKQLLAIGVLVLLGPSVAHSARAEQSGIYPAGEDIDINRAKELYEQFIGGGVQVVKESSSRKAGINVEGEKKLKTIRDGKSNLSAGAGLDFTHFGEGVTEVSVLGNVIVDFQGNKVARPFGRFSFGIQHCCEGTDPAVQEAFGVDLGVLRMAIIRAEIAFRQVFFEGETFGSTIFRGTFLVPLGGRQ